MLLNAKSSNLLFVRYITDLLKNQQLNAAAQESKYLMCGDSDLATKS